MLVGVVEWNCYGLPQELCPTRDVIHVSRVCTARDDMEYHLLEKMSLRNTGENVSDAGEMCR